MKALLALTVACLSLQGVPAADARPPQHARHRAAITAVLKNYETALNANCTWLQYWVQLDTAEQRRAYHAYLTDYATRQHEAGRYQRPVNVRSADQKGALGNRVSMMLPSVPVGIIDPAERLTAVRAEMERLKSSDQANAFDALAELFEHGSDEGVGEGVLFAGEDQQDNLLAAQECVRIDVEEHRAVAPTEDNDQLRMVVGGFGVALNVSRAVGVPAVNYDLHLCISVARLPREIRADADDAIDLAGEHHRL